MKVIFISGYYEDAFRQRSTRDSQIHFRPSRFIETARTKVRGQQRETV